MVSPVAPRLHFVRAALHKREEKSYVSISACLSLGVRPEMPAAPVWDFCTDDVLIRYHSSTCTVL